MERSGRIKRGVSRVGGRPAALFYRKQYGLQVELELPGVSERDLELSVSSNVLALSGTRRDQRVEEGCSHWRMEIAYSRFSRRLKFPNPIEGARFQVASDGGWMIIRIFEGG